MTSGLKQGCKLSFMLFNLCINDLISFVDATGVGIELGGEIICSLLYADDLVLMAETESGLQVLLNALHSWTTSNNMMINVNKSCISGTKIVQRVNQSSTADRDH